MGVLIEGMEIPETCGERQFDVWSEDHEHFCAARPDVRSFDSSAIWRVKHCPLIEVPEPHGPLYDLYDIFDDMQHSRGIDINCSSPGMTADLFQGYAPVIPASKEG